MYAELKPCHPAQVSQSIRDNQAVLAAAKSEQQRVADEAELARQAVDNCRQRYEARLGAPLKWTKYYG